MIQAIVLLSATALATQPAPSDPEVDDRNQGDQENSEEGYADEAAPRVPLLPSARISGNSSGTGEFRGYLTLRVPTRSPNEADFGASVFGGFAIKDGSGVLLSAPTSKNTPVDATMGLSLSLIGTRSAISDAIEDAKFESDEISEAELVDKCRWARLRKLEKLASKLARAEVLRRVIRAESQPEPSLLLALDAAEAEIAKLRAGLIKLKPGTRSDVCPAYQKEHDKATRKNAAVGDVSDQWVISVAATAGRAVADVLLPSEGEELVLHEDAETWSARGAFLYARLIPGVRTKKGPKWHAGIAGQTEMLVTGGRRMDLGSERKWCEDDGKLTSGQVFQKCSTARKVTDRSTLRIAFSGGMAGGKELGWRVGIGPLLHLEGSGAAQGEGSVEPPSLTDSQIRAGFLVPLTLNPKALLRPSKKTIKYEGLVRVVFSATWQATCSGNGCDEPAALFLVGVDAIGARSFFGEAADWL